MKKNCYNKSQFEQKWREQKVITNNNVVNNSSYFCKINGNMNKTYGKCEQKKSEIGQMFSKFKPH